MGRNSLFAIAISFTIQKFTTFDFSFHTTVFVVYFVRTFEVFCPARPLLHRIIFFTIYRNLKPVAVIFDMGVYMA